MTNKKDKPLDDTADSRTPRVRGTGNPDSHSQDADRHRKIDHPKSDK